MQYPSHSCDPRADTRPMVGQQHAADARAHTSTCIVRSVENIVSDIFSKTIRTWWGGEREDRQGLERAFAKN